MHISAVKFISRYKILFLLFISLAFSFRGISQEVETEVMEVLKQSDLALSKRDTSLALELANKALELADDDNGITRAVASNKLAEITSLTSGDGKEAFELYLSAYLLMINEERDNKGLAQSIIIESIIGIGDIYYKNGFWSRAINVYNKLPKNYGNSIGSKYKTIEHNIMNSYYRNGDYKKLIEVCKKNISNNLDVEYAYVMMSKSYASKGDYTSAISSEIILLSIYESNNSDSLMVSKLRLADLYFHNNSNSKADSVYKVLLKLPSVQNDEFINDKIRYKLSKVYSATFKYTEANILMKEVIDGESIDSNNALIIKSINHWILIPYYQKKYKVALSRLRNYISSFEKIKNLKIRIQLYNTAMIIYEQVGDISNAFIISKKLNSLNSSVLIKSNSRLADEVKQEKVVDYISNNIFDKRIKLELDRKDVESKQLLGEKKKVVKNNKILFKSSILFLVLAFVFLIVIVIIYKQYKERKKLSADLEASNNRISKALEQRDKQHAALTVSNNELEKTQTILKDNNNNLELKTQEVNNKNKELESALEQIRDMQDQLIESQRLASLGQVTAGIAHEIRNPLNFVMNYSTLIEDLLVEVSEIIEDEIKLPQSEDKKELDEILKLVSENAHKINSHGERAAKIISDMLNVSRKGSSTYELTDVNQLIKDSTDLAFEGEKARIPGFNIDLEFDLDEQINNIAVVKQDLGRVLINLVGNACQAIEPKLANDSNFVGKILVSSRCDNNSIILSVKDNGSGMDDDVKDKIFTPFFTTKPAGKGTGLGLTMTYDIITKLHKGKVSVESTKGKSTVFIIEIPNNLDS